MREPLEDRIAHALREAGVEILWLHADGATVRKDGGPECALQFGNLRRMAAVSPPDWHDMLVARFVHNWLGELQRVSREPPVVKPASRPVRPADDSPALYPHLLPQDVDNQGLGAPWVEPLAGGNLHFALVVDAPSSMRLVKPIDFSRWRLSVSEARARAMRNLADSSTGLARHAAERPAAERQSPLSVETGDGHDAARLLVAHAWFPGACGVLALVPSRDLLVVIPVYGRAELDRALSRAVAQWAWTRQATRRLPYPLSPHLYWRSEGLLSHVPVEVDEARRIRPRLPAAALSALDVATA